MFASPAAHCARSAGSPLWRRLSSSLAGLAARGSQRRGVPVLVAGLLASATAGAGAYAYNTDPGLQRSASFWAKVTPIYLHYRYIDYKTKNWPSKERDAAFQPLHEKYSPMALDIILQLRGFYIKIGQIGVGIGDLMPKEYIDTLSSLQDDVPHESIDYVKEVISASLGRPVDEIFSEIDSEPLGSASIGQVHRARLKNGREVAVKVKYPTVESVFESDFDTMQAFCKLAQPEQVPFLKEVKKQFMTEFDLKREAESLRVAHDALGEKFDSVVVPQPVMELCTRDVLVMEYLPGVKLVEGLETQFRRLAKMRNMDFEKLKREQAKRVEMGDVKSGPGKWQLRAYAAWVRLYSAMVNSLIWTYNSTAGWLAAPLDYRETVVPLNTAEIMDTLWDVLGYQVFVMGQFNGDPHPGNFLLLPDGRIGVIDFGQVKRLSVKDRVRLAQLLVALADGDDDAIVEAHKAIGLKTKYDDPYVQKQMAVIGFDRHTKDVMEGMNIQQYMEYLSKRDPVVESAEEFIIVGRASILLRGLGMHLSQVNRTCVKWRPFAEALLRQYPTPESVGEDAPFVVE